MAAPDVVARPSATPELSERKLRTLLHAARTDVGITQRQVCADLGWSVSKLIRIEQGRVVVSPTDVQALLKLYGAQQTTRDYAQELARTSRNYSEWTEFRDIYSQDSLSLFANEQSARLVQKYEVSLIPGLLQAEEYARALFVELGAEKEKVDRYWGVRLRRQELLERADGPTLNFILGEAAVSRPIGGARVMRNQLDRLKTLAQADNITISLLPFAAGVHPGLDRSFTILHFEDAFLVDMVYLESAETESIKREDNNIVAEYCARFKSLQARAGPSDLLPALLDEVAQYRYTRNSDRDQVSRPLASNVEPVFLCHSSEDKDQVRDLYRRLREDGQWPWLDEVDILPGQDWGNEIRDAIRNSRKILVCLSRASISKRGYVQREIRQALDVADEQPEGTIFLIPVRLEECQLPRRLAAWQWVDLFAPDGYQRLLSSLAHTPPH
jgi:transcriptional regulator with XRE-family HTH domain